VNPITLARQAHRTYISLSREQALAAMEGDRPRVQRVTRLVHLALNRYERRYDKAMAGTHQIPASSKPESDGTRAGTPPVP
jgi:hypothetical protein